MGNFNITSVPIQQSQSVNNGISNTNLETEKQKKPNLEDPSNIMNHKVDKIFQCKRNLNVLGIGHHTDTIFCSKQSCLLVSFHENVSRVDIGKFDLIQAKDLYYTCEEYLVEGSYKMSDINYKSKQIAARKQYAILYNNCNHSAQELLDELRITFHRTKQPKDLK